MKPKAGSLERLKQMQDLKKTSLDVPYGKSGVRRITEFNVDDCCRVTEQEAASIQGEFDFVMLRWEDITFHTVEGVDPESEEGRAALAGEPELSTLEFVQFGIKVAEDPDKVVIMHSMSVQPGRSEFFVIPKGVIREESKIGRVKVEGSTFSRVE